MKSSIRSKLENLSERLEELNALLADPEIIADQNKFRTLSQEYAEVNPVVGCFQRYQTALSDIDAAQEMLAEDDAEIRAMAEEEITEARERKEELELELQKLLLPKDPNDDKNIFIEIR